MNQEIIQKIQKLSKKLSNDDSKILAIKAIGATMEHHDPEIRKKQTKVSIETEVIKSYIEKLQKKGFLKGNRKRDPKLILERTALINLLDSKNVDNPFRFKSYSNAFVISVNMCKKYAYDTPDAKLVSEFEKILF